MKKEGDKNKPLQSQSDNNIPVIIIDDHNRNIMKDVFKISDSEVDGIIKFLDSRIESIPDIDLLKIVLKEDKLKHEQKLAICFIIGGITSNVEAVPIPISPMNSMEDFESSIMDDMPLGSMILDKKSRRIGIGG